MLVGCVRKGRKDVGYTRGMSGSERKMEEEEEESGEESGLCCELGRRWCVDWCGWWM